MREVLFSIVAERPGHLEAQADGFAIRIAAPTLEELQLEAREALIQQLGPAHCAYRIRIRRSQPKHHYSIRQLGCLPALCS